MLGLDVGGDFATLGLRVKSEGIQKAKAEVKGLGTQAKKTEKEFTGLSNRMDTLMTAAGLAAVGLGIAKVIQLGASVNETASKYRTVLGPAIGDANDFLGEFATVAGLSQTAGQDLVATSVAMAEAFGATKTEAIGFTEEILKTSSDLASFNDVAGGTEEVFRALRASFTGEFEQLKKSNIVLREAAITQRALTNAQKERKEELTLMERAEATLQLAVEQAGVAMGDLERTQYSLANQTRQTGARLTDMRDSLASMAALGVETSGVMAELNDVLALLASDGSGTKSFFGELGEIFGGFLQKVETSVIAFQTFGRMLGAIGETWSQDVRFGAQALRGVIAEGEARIREAEEEYALRKEIVEDEESLAEILEKQEEARIAARKLAEEEAALAAKALKDAEAAAEAAEKWKEQIEGVVIGLREVSDMGSLSPFGVDRRDAFDRALGRSPDFERGVGPLPEITAQFEAAGMDMGDQLKGLEKIFNDLGLELNDLQSILPAVGGLFGDVGRSMGELAAAGIDGNPLAIGGGIVGLLTQVFDNSEHTRRIDSARDAFERALNGYVDTLADMSRVERLQAAAEEGLRDILGTMFTASIAGIKSDKIRDALQERFEKALADMDIDKIQELLGEFGADGSKALEEYKRRLVEVKKLIAEEAEAKKKAAEDAAERARLEAEREAERLRQREIQGIDTRDSFGQRSLALGGNDRASLAGSLALSVKRETRGLEELLAEGIISQTDFESFLTIMQRETAAALRDFDEAAREAAEASREAARAEEYRARVDMENLEIRRLVALGLEDEVNAKRQQLELDDAIFAGRSDQYIALLLIVQAEEAAARERARNAAATREQAQVLKESTKQIDGFSKALNGPAGLLLALRRSQAIIGAGSPNGLGLPTTAPQSVVINVSGAGSPEDVGKAIQRVLRRGGQNPTNRVG